jgi:NADH-quinone oxidoreductase subunit M
MSTHLYSAGAVQALLLPLIGAAVLLLLPFRRQAAGMVALIVQAGMIGLTYNLVRNYDNAAPERFQYATDKTWLPDLGIRFHIAIDGLSLVMVAMTVVVLSCALLYALWDGHFRGRSYYGLLLVLEAALVLLFVARDLIVFYVGFEAMLIPLYLLVGIWGGENRRRATIKFVIYTFIGTLLMLVGMIALGLHAGSFDLDKVGTSGERWIFVTFLIAFAIKSPIWPLHGWVPDAYREAPPEVAAILSGVASKAGAYGLLRLVLPIFPQQVADFRWCVVGAALIGLLYGSIVAFRQPDSRGVIAYSSIGQMGLVVLGIFVLNDRGTTGAVFQMVNHALLSAALFLIAGWVARKTGADPFVRLGGLARGRPILATVCIVVGVAALAVPGSSTFASEFLILLGAFEAKWFVGAIASLAIVLAAMYLLRWVSAVLHDREGVAVGDSQPPDLEFGPMVAILPLVAAILALSFYPYAVTNRVDKDAGALAAHAVEVLGK